MSEAHGPVTFRSRSFFPSVVTLAIAVSIVFLAYLAEGSLASQRVMVDLIMPVGLGWLASIYNVAYQCINGTKQRLVMAVILSAIIGVTFNPILTRMLIAGLEGDVAKASPLEASANRYRAVVVLGGGAFLGRNDEAQLNKDGHRIVLAAQLWHAGKTDAIICTGADNFVPGSESLDRKSLERYNPSRLGFELLRSLDVPEDRIFLIDGMNTSAEMTNLHLFLQSPPPTFPARGDIGLITSAFHIPRARRLAEARGLTLLPLPTSYRTGSAEPFSVIDLVPTAESGATFFQAMREHLASLVGR